MKIDKYKLTHKSKPLFIAEAAVEHLGSLEVAKRMVDASAKVKTLTSKYNLECGG